MFSDDGRRGYYSLIDTGVSSFAVAWTGRVYALKTNGVFLASDVGYAPYYWLIDSSVSSFGIASDGNVGYVNYSGILYQVDPIGQRSQVSFDSFDLLSVAPNGTIFVHDKYYPLAYKYTPGAGWSYVPVNATITDFGSAPPNW